MLGLFRAVVERVKAVLAVRAAHSTIVRGWDPSCLTGRVSLRVDLTRPKCEVYP
jgi:hypothetical protein